MSYGNEKGEDQVNHKTPTSSFDPIPYVINAAPELLEFWDIETQSKEAGKVQRETNRILPWPEEEEPTKKSVPSQKETERETDPHRLEQRAKNLQHGKNTIAYANYTQAVER
jgi:hypothetical protein